MVLRRHLCWLALLGLSCTWSTTRELLDLTFMDSVPRKFQANVPSIVESTTPFVVTVIYTDNAGNRSAGRFAKHLNWSVVGAGSIIQAAEGTITQGVYQATLVYTNSALTVGQTASIQIKVVDPGNAAVSGTTGIITARFPVTHSTFKFSTPYQVFQSTGFSVTITAAGNDGNLYSNYNGTANLSASVTGLSVPDGTLSPSTVIFTNGIATITNLQYTKPAGSLYITATDQADSTKTGKSNAIQVAGNPFSVTAVPVPNASVWPAMDSVRIGWTQPNTSYRFNVYRQNSQGNFVQIAGSPVISVASMIDTDPTLVQGTTYTYKVTASDSSGNLLNDATVQVLYQNCATFAPANITVNTAWTLAMSPVCLNAAYSITAALTIDAGVVVQMSGLNTITVGAGGSIRTNGTVNLPVIFTSSAANPASPAWNGITLAGTAVVNPLSVSTSGNEAISETNGSTGSSFSYAVFEYAKNALVANVPAWVENSLFRKNYSNAAVNDAAGVFVNVAAAQYVVIRGSAFVGNAHANTAGVNGSDLGTGAGSFVVRNSTVQGSTGGVYGPILFNSASPATATFNGISVYNSTSVNAGGAINGTAFGSGQGALTVRNSYFSGTTAGNQGGAIVCGGTSSCTVISSTFESTACTGSYGGAIAGNNGSNYFAYNFFKGTSAVSGGGAIYLGSNSTVLQNTFYSTQGTSNSALGGAVHISGSGNAVQNNSFYGTYVNSSSGNGGGAISDLGAGSNTIGFNHIYNTSTSGSGGAAYFGGANTGNNFSHNNMVGTKRSGNSPNGLHNATNTNFTVANNWWGSTYAATQCQPVAGNLCETTQVNIPTLTTNASSAWPLCCADPSNAACVGATTLPSYQACQ